MTAHRQLVIDYFDQTHNDYRWLWGIDRHLGLHCGFFDAQHRHHDEAVLNMNRVLARTARITAGQRVLDAGCGIGGSAVWLAENVGAEVIGVNVNPKQLKRAHRLASERGLAPSVQFQEADFSDTQLAAESFDVVWALESACYAENKPAMLQEAYRLLKPGGRLVVADGFLTSDELREDERMIIDRWQRGWAIPGVVSADQFGHWLFDAGFHGIEFRDITRHVIPSSQRIYWASLLFYPVGWLWQRLGLRTPMQTRGIAAGYYQFVARRRGLGIYGLFLAEK
jgi:cyclopropane fatty-acyl-phospholipid synthase-like methyltransferase